MSNLRGAPLAPQVVTWGCGAAAAICPGTLSSRWTGRHRLESWPRAQGLLVGTNQRGFPGPCTQEQPAAVVCRGQTSFAQLWERPLLWSTVCKCGASLLSFQVIGAPEGRALRRARAAPSARSLRPCGPGHRDHRPHPHTCASGAACSGPESTRARTETWQCFVRRSR